MLLSPEERARWQEATQPVIDEFKCLVGEDLIEQARTTIANGSS